MVIAMEDQLQFVGRHIYYFEDEFNQYSVEEILQFSDQGKFQLHDKDVFNKNPTTSDFWFRVTVRNETQGDLWLQVGDAFTTWYLDFYAPDSANEYGKPLQLGSLRPQKNKLFPSNYYCVPLSKGGDQETKTYYLRISGGFPRTHIFQIGTLGSLTDLNKEYDYIIAAFVGVMLSMIIYNTFLLFSIREKIYLFYVGYLVSVIIIVPFINGYPLFYADWLWNYYFVYQGVMALMVTLFATHYLNLAKLSPRLYRWLWFLIALIGLAGVFNLIFVEEFPTIVNLLQPVLFAFNISLAFSGIYALSKGQKNAHFYVIGWAFVITSMVTFILTVNGVLPVNRVTSNALYIGFSLEAVMFGLALGDRWKRQKTRQIELENIAENNAFELQQQTLHLINMSNQINDTQQHLKKLTGLSSLTRKNIQKIVSGIAVNKSMENEWIQFDSYFSKTHEEFNENLRLRHKDLSIQERRLCTLIKMGLGTNEIASIMSIEPRSVVMGRYRLKKKLGLSENQDLHTYVESF